MSNAKPGLVETLIDHPSQYPSDACRDLIKKGHLIDSYELIRRGLWRIWSHRIINSVPILPVVPDAT